MQGNITHTAVGFSTETRYEVIASENGAYLFAGDAQLCFGHGRHAIETIDILVRRLVDLKAGLVERLGEPVTADAGDHYVRA